MKHTLYTLLLLFTIISCNSNKKSDSTAKDIATKKALIEKRKTDSLYALVKIEIENIVPLLDSVKNNKVANELIFSKYLLKESYKDAGYSALWRSKKNRTDLVNEITHANEHGLIPEDYHLDVIQNYLTNYDSLSATDQARLDILLTDSIILYAYHLRKGKVNPEELIYSWNFIENSIPKTALEILQKALLVEQIGKVLHRLEPQDKEYQMLKKQLLLNEKRIKKGGWKRITFKKTLHPDEENRNLPLLRDRLIAENYLIPTDTSSTTVYDVKLQEAVKKFQILHGLNGDGVIGKTTLDALNTSIEKNQEKIICNLERRRWMRYPKDTAYIKVNIASFKLEYKKNEALLYESRVVVGRDKNKTPFFMDYLEQIVLNPTWTLPYSIATKETLPKLKRNANYLRTHNMILMNSKGNIVNSQAIDWSAISARKFPYIVRQKPGAGNALGRVKFLFPNKYAIYLHDTPSKRFFSKDKRAFSHGCIRLENPLAFAEFLLKMEDSKWNMKRIDNIIASSKTKKVVLTKKHPVLLVYQTAVVNKNNEVVYYNDIYKRDKKLYQLLSQKN